MRSLGIELASPTATCIGRWILLHYRNLGNLTHFLNAIYLSIYLTPIGESWGRGGRAATSGHGPAGGIGFQSKDTWEGHPRLEHTEPPG